jgi:hypothetical protein
MSASSRVDELIMDVDISGLSTLLISRPSQWETSDVVRQCVEFSR